MSTDTFDLLELCDLADVTPRTVRYYVQHGLVPSPGTRGPGARYDRGHLDRLQLIKRLQREHLPLAEIRQRLASLDDAAVAELVQLRKTQAPAGNALDYVRDVLASSSHDTVAPRHTVAPAPTRKRYSVAEPSAPPMHVAESAPPARATWERLTLAPDVELHVRRPLSRAQNKLVDRLIDHARSLFSEA